MAYGNESILRPFWQWVPSDAAFEQPRMTLPEVCPLCQARPDEFAVAGNHVYGGAVEQKFYECPDCDVAFLFPAMSDEEERRFYTMEFEKFMETRAGSDRGWRLPQVHVEANQDHVRRRVPFLEDELCCPGLRVLEIGCSSGFMLYALRERGAEVYGIEPSGVFSDFVRSQDVPVYESLDEFERQSDAAGHLDLIVHFFVFEHIRHPVLFLNQCLGLLKPRGRMFFEVPSRSDPLITIYDVPAFQQFYWSVAHHWYFNRNSLEFVLGKVGGDFELIPEQRYDLSNHFWWALEGKPGGLGKFSRQLTPALDAAYKQSMRITGHCDTFFVWLNKAARPGTR